jgi:predicted metal-dependent hydrolase
MGFSMSNQFADNKLPEFLQVGEEVLPLVIKRHAKAKRICLRYNPTDHAISLTLPRHTKISDGLDFLTEKSQWLIDTLSDMPLKKQIKPGVVIPLCGERVRIKHEPQLGRQFALMDETLYIAGAREFFPRRVTEALKKVAAIRIRDLAVADAAKIGKRINRISVRDTRSRWGSCSSTANLSFSWRLVFAPREVMEYVVAHEVAHLRYMDHSANFWALVEYLCPNHEIAKEWLRLHGKHLYRFNA